MDRGQAHTLEAIAAALLLVTSIGFALQMAAVTPLSASTSSQHLENQLEATAEGTLASTAQTGELKEAVLYWNLSGEQFHTADNGVYYTNTTAQPATEFASALNRTFSRRNIAYNVHVRYHTGDGQMDEQRMIYQGEPSDHAVSATRTITLVDDDRIVDEDGSLNASTLREAPSGSFYIPDAGNWATGNRGIYNQVTVEVVAWRI